MKIRAVSLFGAVACLGLLVSCEGMGQGKNSDVLSRGTALAILHDNSRQLLGEGDYWSMDAFVTVAEEPQHRMGREFEMQYLEFLNTLAEAGIFRRETNRDTVHRDFQRIDG